MSSTGTPGDLPDAARRFLEPRQAPQRRRLSRSAEFDRVYREGRSHATRQLVVYWFPAASTSARSGEDGVARLGISVGRKVGGAVTRNKVKRQLREAFWTMAARLPAGHDFVIVARADSARLAEEDGATGFELALRDLLADAGVLSPPA